MTSCLLTTFQNKKAPIHHVCERRLSGVLETLIQYGASLNVKDKVFFKYSIKFVFLYM